MVRSVGAGSTAAAIGGHRRRRRPPSRPVRKRWPLIAFLILFLTHTHTHTHRVDCKSSFIGCAVVILAKAGLNRVFTGFYWVLLLFTGFYRALLGFTGFYWVFTGLYWVLLGNTGLNSDGRRSIFFEITIRVSDFVIDQLDVLLLQ